MHQEWLLVFDGITFSRDDDISEFRPFLPWNSRCSIIYTSTDRTLQKKHRLFEPFCLSIPPLAAEDACKILYKDLGIEKPTKEQALRARELVEHYECLPLAIHAIGHRLRATNKQIETFHVKNQVVDVKLAQPFLSIMNDMLRLELLQALNLVHLLSFLGHRIPVGLLSFGRHSMSADNAEMVTCAQAGEDPDVDTTLGTLIHYGLIERTSDAASFDVQSSALENSEEAFSTIYHGNSSFDTVKIHRVVQQFCRDELRIKDEDCKDAATKEEPGFHQSWLIVAARFICKSYEAAHEVMAHYEDRGLIGDYREYETHASRLVELFPKKHGAHPPVLHEARENLRLLMKSIGNNIERMSWSPSREISRNQKSVFDWDWEEESRSRANSAPLNSPALSALEENTDIAAVSSPQCDGSNDGNKKEVTGGIGDQLHTRDSGAYIRAEVSDQNLVISQARDQIIPTEYSAVKHDNLLCP